MSQNISRRDFVKRSVQAGVAASIGLPLVARAIEPIKRTGAPRFRMSLVAYSFRQYFGAKEADKKLDLFKFMDFAAENGCDGVEVTQYYFEKEVTDAYLIKLRRHAFLRGLEISGTGVGNSFALAKGDKLDEQIANAKKRIDYAAVLGAPYVRLFSGGIKDKALTHDDALKSVVAAMEECAEYAGKKGIFIGMENDQGMTTTVDGTLEIIKAVKSPWFGSNCDTGNFHETQDVYADIEKLAPYAINVHFKSELHPRGKNGEKLDMPVDMPRMIKILADANYQGYVGLEYAAQEDPWTAVPRLLKEMKGLMRG